MLYEVWAKEICSTIIVIYSEIPLMLTVLLVHTYINTAFMFFFVSSFSNYCQ